MVNIVFPSDSRKPIIEVFYLEGSPFLICGVNGRITGRDIDEIENEIKERVGFFDEGEGTYLLEAFWEKPQTDEYGRVELPGYWDFMQIAFRGDDLFKP